MPILLVFLLCAAMSAQTLFVSPAGKAEWSGRLPAPNADGADGPLPSPAAARDAIRSSRASGASGPVSVLIRQGTYFLAEPLVLEPRDSNVTYAGYPGERPVLSGGRRITGWQKGQGPAWIAPAPWQFRQLFVGGRRAQRARTPNFGFFRIDGPSSQDTPFQLRFRGSEIKPQWAGKDVEAVALLAWAELRSPIAAVDPAAHVATLAANPRPSNREADARYYIENAPDALDSPGEWYLDRAAGTVSYRPVPGDDLGRDEVIAPALTHLVLLQGRPEQGEFVRDVAFRGLDFRHTDWVLPAHGYADTQAAIEAASAFEAAGAENCVIERCRFSRHGGYAVWFGRGSKRNRVVHCEIRDMGAGGVKLGETRIPAAESDRNYGNRVTDNDIHDLGIVYPAAVGVWVGQSGENEISHNHIHDLFYTAISVGWTWGYGPNDSKGNRIEYNWLHNIGKEMLSDMGAIYTLGVQPGTVIRNNLIHDVSSFTYGGWGIYPDEGSTGMLIENNVVYRCNRSGFHQHYGRENVVRNNIFALNGEFEIMRTRAEPHLSFTFERNIVYLETGSLLGGNWTGENYRFERNLYWDARGGEILFAGKTLKEWQASGRDRDSIVADPQFVNAGSYDFRLRRQSPAFRVGFQPIDLTGVGPREEGAAGAAPRRTLN